MKMRDREGAERVHGGELELRPVDEANCGGCSLGGEAQRRSAQGGRGGGGRRIDAAFIVEAAPRPHHFQGLRNKLLRAAKPRACPVSALT